MMIMDGVCLSVRSASAPSVMFISIVCLHGQKSAINYDCGGTD